MTEWRTHEGVTKEVSCDKGAYDGVSSGRTPTSDELTFWSLVSSDLAGSFMFNAYLASDYLVTMFFSNHGLADINLFETPMVGEVPIREVQFE